VIQSARHLASSNEDTGDDDDGDDDDNSLFDSYERLGDVERRSRS
jgi:hypothetical protein